MMQYIRVVATSKLCLLCGVLAMSFILYVLIADYRGSGIDGIRKESAAHQNVFLASHQQADPSSKQDTSGTSCSSCVGSIPDQVCRMPEKSDRSAELASAMDGLTGSNVKPDNPKLVKAIQEHFIDLPRPFITKFSMPIVDTPQAKEVIKILKGKTNGFFIECGALDGERSSNTIWLEQKKGWNGLLVEMDPSYYLQVRGKNRKCFSINACLSPETYPTKMQFKEHQMGMGRLVTESKTLRENPELIIDTYCFPLYSLMLALNRTRIDYFSLDVEGMELPILKSIPFDKLDIAVLTVEYVHGKSSSEYLRFMESKGYKMVKQLNFVIKELYLGGNDYVFVREDLL